MKNANMTKAQKDFIAARDALAIAVKAYRDALTTTGLQAKIDAWEDGNLSPEVQSAHDAIFDKLGMKQAHAEMSRAELALVTCLCDAIEKRSPTKRAMFNALRKHIATSTRYCPRRIELVALALEWKW
jgi:hypothetical protein